MLIRVETANWATLETEVHPMHLPTLLLLAPVFMTGVAYAQSTPPASGEVRFISINENALLSSALMGLDVHNEGRELLGKVEDVVFEGGQLVGIVLKIGQGSAPTHATLPLIPPRSQ